jgi:SPASM domain peptide maturase of grasp-with-spasm system
MTIDAIEHQCIALYPDCFAVRGACKSAIYDLTRREIVRFPSAYLDLLEEAQKDTVGSVLSRADDEQSRQSMVDFFELLIRKEFINLSVSPRALPGIKEVWDSPCHIQNAIIDIKDQAHDFETIFGQLDKLGCEIVQIRCFTNLHSLDEMQHIVALACHTSIQGIELLLKYDPRYSDEAYVRFMESVPIVSQLTIHSSPVDKTLITTFGCESESDASIVKKMFLVQDRISSQHHCGVIHAGNVIPPTTAVFFENKLYNGCLNRKISIDADGFIRNCPSMRPSFGHHKRTSLSQVAMDDSFRSAWHIKKDMIKKCRDCEFRYACTDCRAYLEEPRDIFSKPLKCGYDPYTGTWDNWDRDRAEHWVTIHYPQVPSSAPTG